MGKRFEETSQLKMLQAIEKATGHTFDDDTRAETAAGASEVDLVNSGLEDTMATAYHAVREAAGRLDLDLRTAAYVIAIGKVGQIYQERRIWP
jgi:glutamate dehydrogenase (NAD(P)+)